MKTFMAKASENKTNKWYLFDADGKILGRLATKVAMIIMGKHRPEYTPHVDLGDHVVIINSKKIVLKGTNKPLQKKFMTYSGYTGGSKTVSLERMLQNKPDEVIREAVRRMLPKNYLAQKMLKKLKIYSDANHEHTAQKPEKVTF